MNMARRTHLNTLDRWLVQLPEVAVHPQFRQPRHVKEKTS
jgi:hypothetical protein